MNTQLAQAGANLFVAGCLGAAIGLERQWRQRLAGLRTNTLVALGAAIFVTYSRIVLDDQGAARMAAQVVSGIGFLGAGVIFKEGLNVRGLNRQPVDTIEEEQHYLVSISCRPAVASDVRSMLVHQISLRGDHAERHHCRRLPGKLECEFLADQRQQRRIGEMKEERRGGKDRERAGLKQDAKARRRAVVRGVMGKVARAVVIYGSRRDREDRRRRQCGEERHEQEDHTLREEITDAAGDECDRGSRRSYAPAVAQAARAARVRASAPRRRARRRHRRARARSS